MSTIPPILVWGSGPNSSKSHVCLALLRLLARSGLPVIPFKAITVLEPERWRQARSGCPIPHHVAAARTVWRPAMTPVVIKITANATPIRGALSVNGEHCGVVPLLTPDTLDGADLARSVRYKVETAIRAALSTLAAVGAPLVVEGAGSPVDALDDLANLLVARALPTRRIVLSSYCWSGGSLAATIGTLQCLPADLRDSIVGFIQNRPASEEAGQRWAATIIEHTGLPLVATVGDLSWAASADQLESTDDLADPWADAFAMGAELSSLFSPHSVST